MKETGETGATGCRKVVDARAFGSLGITYLPCNLNRAILEMEVNNMRWLGGFGVR